MHLKHRGKLKITGKICGQGHTQNIDPVHGPTLGLLHEPITTCIFGWTADSMKTNKQDKLFSCSYTILCLTLIWFYPTKLNLSFILKKISCFWLANDKCIKLMCYKVQYGISMLHVLNLSFRVEKNLSLFVKHKTIFKVCRHIHACMHSF